jgi:hypothetical protein
MKIPVCGDIADLCRKSIIRHAQVDVARPIAHLASAVVADIPPADVITPEDQNVLACSCHLNLLFIGSVISN